MIRRSHPQYPASPARQTATENGVALVLVLLCLVILSGLVIAFLSNVTTEASVSSGESAMTAAKALSDSAVNLVIGQIVDATKSDTQAGDTGSAQIWASQPGMIRTYLNSGSNGKLYKLYSSDQLITDGATFNPEHVPQDWSQPENDGIYTDLNAPVGRQDSGGTIQWHYPIIDPRAATQDPSKGLGGTRVDGFSIANAPGYKPGVNDPAHNNAAPMPVKWLYMLADGTLAAGKVVNGAITVPGASKTNPIKSRIAFWTDDECCKVNLNTASEGTYWDMPRTISKEDAGVLSGKSASSPGLSLCQPTAREYQRYPGHPATTCLSPILASYGFPAPDPTKPPTMGTDPKQLEAYYDLVPKISYTDHPGSTLRPGSRGGTVIPYIDTTKGSAPALISPDFDRLYASVGELIFKASAPPINLSAPRIQNLAPTSPGATDGLSNSTVEQIKFFLSVSSNAPEVTIFNTPRISMWPEWEDATKRTVFDKTIAYCSTLGSSHPFYFTRQNPRSMSQDYTPRNAALYQYLQGLMKTNVPGFGGRFSTKFSSDADQILTNIYDYIRCTNLYDTTPAASGTPAATPFTPLSTLLTLTDRGGGEVLPIKIGNTQGFGRYASVTELDLVFFPTNSKHMVPSNGTSSTTEDATQMGAIVLVNFNSPMQGLPGFAPNIKFTIKGLDQLNANGQKLFGLTPSATDFIENAPVRFGEGRGIGGTDDPNMTLSQADKPIFYYDINGGLKGMNRPNADQKGNYPFFTHPTQLINIDTTASTFTFKGGDITIIIRSADKDDARGAETPGEVIQTIQMHIPDGTFAKPRVTAGTPLRLFYDTPTIVRTSNAMRRDQGTLITDGDTVVGMENAGPGDNPQSTTADTNPAAGDMRMVAALPVVPPSYYHAHQDWNATVNTNRKAYGIMRGVGVNGYPGTTSGTLVRGMHRGGSGALPNYHLRWPDVPSRVVSSASDISTGVTRRDKSSAGDWDTGYGLQKDGAYLNLPDMGDVSFEDIDDQLGNYRHPYIVKEDHFLGNKGSGVYFSPNRMIPSSMMLGSIPTGVLRNMPWQTLLFNPKPEDPNHPGRVSPPDHLIADLFWMPVVEPYAISQPFSTAGKINMNYEIQPFTYIRRATGMYAVMKSTKFMAMSPQLFGAQDPRPLIQREQDVNGAMISSKLRYAIDIPATLADFDTKFKSGQIFKSATQISEMNLYPAGSGITTSGGMASFWKTNNVTGDNLREKPYADIYPRLTTKSNTYTVHFRVQVLKKTPNTPPDQWKNGQDSVTAEYRGSSTIERYIDLNDPNLPDFATLSPSDPKFNIDRYYKIRVVGTTHFTQ